MSDSRLFRLLVLALVITCLRSSTASRARETLQGDSTVVSYSGVGREYAEAIQRVVTTARVVAAESFGMDMPRKIFVEITADPEARVRLFNDGKDHFSLTVRTDADLARPADSGIFHIYGLCHEVAHLAMYRPIRDHSWMKPAAAEGWAHYLGSRMVDQVYEQEGARLWPDRYDYRDDGMPRLLRQLAEENPSEMTAAAGRWKGLCETVGDRGIAGIFSAWAEPELDSTNPAPQLGERLGGAASDPAVAQWWRESQELIVLRRAASTFVAHHARANTSQDKVTELAHDDGEQAGKKSIAGGGHGVRFQVAGDSWFVTSVRLFGSRYGRSQAPDEDLRVWLCDNQFRSFADFRFPYAKFERGDPKWVTLPIKPTQVPREFIVCFGFNPSATKGVFVGYDADGKRMSLTGLPGGDPRAFADGDWLIRASVVQRKIERTWTDASGSFSVKAELLSVADGVVRLKRSDGREIEVPVDKLSADDQQFLRTRSQPAEDTTDTSASSPLSGDPLELKRDDGRPAGKKSFPMGIAAAFETEDDSSYLTSVRIHGARYGQVQAPNEDFKVTLCDESFRPLAEFSFPYSAIQRGNPKWTSLRVKPTKLPNKFVICLDFSPTGSKGVFVSHDADGSGLVGLPGKRAGSFGGGDWMIRAIVDRSKK